MAFKKLTDLSADNTIKIGGVDNKTGKKNPSSIEGYYLGSRKVDSKKSKSGFAYIHILQTAKGNVGVWGKTDLDKQILRVTPGTMIRAEHTGMVPTPNGAMYKYDVYQDADNTVEVTGSVSGSPETEETGDAQVLSGTLDGGYEETSSDDEDSYEESEVDLAEVAAARGRAAANQSRVQSLLNRNKK